jgi:hypothetical protein
MRLPLYDVVDLGTKKGGALVEFFKRACLVTFGVDPSPWQRSRSIGFERKAGEGYCNNVVRAGFRFAIADLATEEGLANLPKGKYYLAWHFLEHLPSKQHSDAAVKRALTQAEKAAWFRLPSFEQDELQGEGVLRKHGMRFTWTNWNGHTSPYLLSDCLKAIEEWGAANPKKRYQVRVKPARRMLSMRDDRIVPIDAPVDTRAYSPAFGPKPDLTFSQPVVAEWEVIVQMMG